MRVDENPLWRLPPMARCVCCPVAFTPQAVESLRALARSTSTPAGIVHRAKALLLRSEGKSLRQVARQLPIGIDNLRKWEKRFAERGVEGLKDAPRCGRPRRFSP